MKKWRPSVTPPLLAVLANNQSEYSCWPAIAHRQDNEKLEQRKKRESKRKKYTEEATKENEFSCRARAMFETLIVTVAKLV